MSGTVVKPCTCASTQQDKLYGRGLRLHNRMVKDRQEKGSRCTVCGKEKTP